MSEIRFYHLERQTMEDALPALLSKALENGHKIIIKGENDTTIKKLNDHLWTYNPNSFLPHGTKSEGYAEDQPVYLTTDNDNPNGADLLILIDGATSESIDQYKLCCTMFDGHNPEALKNARTFWKSCQDTDHDLTYWQQGDRGWQKKDL